MAERHLGQSKQSRVAAILHLSDSQGRAAVSKLDRALSEETDEEVRMVLKSALYSLGNAEHGAEGAEILNDLLRPGASGKEAALTSGCTTQILRSGDRKLLERVIEAAIQTKRPELLFSLAEAVQGFPLREPLPDMGFRHLTFAEDDDQASERLSSWWQAHGEKTTWDAVRRRFVVAP